MLECVTSKTRLLWACVRRSRRCGTPGSQVSLKDNRDDSCVIGLDMEIQTENPAQRPDWPKAVPPERMPKRSRLLSLHTSQNPSESSCQSLQGGDESDSTFFSCDEECAIIGAVSFTIPCRSIGHSSPSSKAPSPEVTPQAACATPIALPVRRKLPAQNTNRMSQYRWLEELLQTIADGRSGGIAPDDFETPRCTPLFVVAGACPNAYCKMQAVMYAQVGSIVDFWWVKPQKDNPCCLEKNTLTLHMTGPFKNNAGRSRSVYSPLAEKFASGIPDGDFTFGIDKHGRAFVEEDTGAGDGSRARLLIYLIWQEDWSSAFAYTKFIRGKICYQKEAALGTRATQGTSMESPTGKVMTTSSSCKSAGNMLFFAREYEFRDGQLSIAAPCEEEAVQTLLPPDSFQEMYNFWV